MPHPLMYLEDSSQSPPEMFALACSLSLVRSRLFARLIIFYFSISINHSLNHSLYISHYYANIGGFFSNGNGNHLPRHPCGLRRRYDSLLRHRLCGHLLVHRHYDGLLRHRLCGHLPGRRLQPWSSHHYDLNHLPPHHPYGSAQVLALEPTLHCRPGTARHVP